MADFVNAARDFVAGATTLEVALAAIGFVALFVALVAWIGSIFGARKRRREAVSMSDIYGHFGQKASEAPFTMPQPPPRRQPPPMQPPIMQPPPAPRMQPAPPPPHQQPPNWGMDGGIVFPASGAAAGRPQRERRAAPRERDPHETGPISSMLAEGLDEIATSGDRVIDAVRERPLEYVAGALAAGFAAGLMLRVAGGRNRMNKLLERILENEESRNGRGRNREPGPKSDPGAR